MDAVFSNIVLYSALNFSDTIFRSNNVAFENFTLIDSFVTLYNSSCSLHLWNIQDIESLTLFKVSDSSLSISQLSVKLFESTSLFNISNSFVDFDQVSIQKCKSLSIFDEIETYFIISNFSVLLNNFIFSGCTYQTVFKSDFEIINSSLILTKSTEVLFLSSLSAQNSSITFSSGYPTISKFASINQNSIFGNDPFLDLSKILSNISISPSQHCCNTSICHVSLNFNNIGHISELLELAVPNNDEFSHNFLLNSLDFFLNNSISFNPMNNSIYFNLTIARIFSFHHLFIPMCPIEYVSLEPPTRGGFVPLFAFNLGLDPIVIHHSTASINQSLEYSSANHQNLHLYFFEGHGCHEIVLSRPTDSIIVSFTYCFKKPFISSISLYPFFLNGELSIIGHDLSTSFDYSSLVDEIASTRVANHSHEEIVHYIPYVCYVESNIFNVYVIIGNQTSNVFQLHLAAPRHNFFPFILSPSGNILRLFGTNFGKMFDCFVNSTIQMSGYASQLVEVTTDELTISTGEIAGLSQFITEIKFIPGISLLLSIPITTLEAYNTSLACFVNQHCEIFVYSLNGEVSMDEFQITTSLPNSIQVFNFQTSHSIAHIEFISTLPGYPDDLDLCNDIGCYPIFNLPFIVLPNSISPRFIQWFDSSFVHEIFLEVEGIHFYEYSAIESSFIFGELASQLVEVQDNIVVFEVQVVSSGSFASLGIDILDSTFSLNLVFEVDNFLLIPQVVQFDSRIEFLLLQPISNVFVSHGRQSLKLTTGSNILQLYGDEPFITLHQSTQLMNVSLITDLVDNQLPFYFEIGFHHSFIIDFNQIIGYIKIFNTQFTSSDHVSVYEHRDIHADFNGLLHSRFKCVVGDMAFQATV
ncbi:hypothetical protein GEMRC1_008831 [Eukaryota sp. GEM-RC1]